MREPSIKCPVCGEPPLDPETKAGDSCKRPAGRVLLCRGYFATVKTRTIDLEGMSKPELIYLLKNFASIIAEESNCPYGEDDGPSICADAGEPPGDECEWCKATQIVGRSFPFHR